jgi:hypothetical protein
MTEATTAETSPRRLPWEPSSRRCANCEKLLRGPFCHDCGQPAHDFERSVWSLLGDAFHTLFNTDNRLFQTLPDLVVRPARLTRNFIAGHRQAQTPPFRLFLVCVLLAFFAGGFREFVQPAGPWYVADYRGEPAPALPAGPSAAPESFAKWFNPRLAHAVSHQREFAMALTGWLDRIAVVLLPISTLLLGALFFSRRRTFLFDHAIFSMHSLSLMGLLFAGITLLSMVATLRGLAALLALAAPAHLFFHLRGVYGSSVVGTFARMFLLLVFSAAAVTALLLGAMLLELNGMVV